MERVEEIKLILTKLDSEFRELKIYKDGSGIPSIIKKIDEIKSYHVEMFKLTNPNEPIKEYLL